LKIGETRLTGSDDVRDLEARRACADFSNIEGKPNICGVLVRRALHSACLNQMFYNPQKIIKRCAALQSFFRKIPR
jgi:hypothetical protein